MDALNSAQLDKTSKITEEENSNILSTKINQQNDNTITPKKKVSFRKNFAKIIKVESYKKYNLLNTQQEPGSENGDKVVCRCAIV